MREADRMRRTGRMETAERMNESGARREGGATWLKRAAAATAAGAVVCLGAAALLAGPAAPSREATSRHAAAHEVFRLQYAAYAQTAPRQPWTTCSACILACQDGGLGLTDCEAACSVSCGLE